MWHLLFLFTGVQPQAVAAPFPGTSSSQVIASTPGEFYSPKGFRLSSGPTAWVQGPPPKHIPSLVTVFRAPVTVDGQQPALTVRVDDLRHTQNLRAYVKQWMKDYPRFGFEVLAAKPVQVAGTPAFLLDLFSKETQKQLRQVVFLKEKTAVILTCRDGRDSFSKTVQNCNDIVRTFKWVN
jgi:hypothetical protein